MFKIRRSGGTKITHSFTIDDPPRQRFLIFINPFGGKGTAKSMFEKEVQPMLEEASIQYELKQTGN